MEIRDDGAAPSVGPGPGAADYCRHIEAYLCRKNDGHLIRIVGPAFDVVSRWEAQGVPLNVACAGIDRYFERYYKKGPRRRPVRVEFCEADVLDAFDGWRRAVGISGMRAAEAQPGEVETDPGASRARYARPASPDAPRATPQDQSHSPPLAPQPVAFR